MKKPQIFLWFPIVFLGKNQKFSVVQTAFLGASGWAPAQPASRGGGRQDLTGPAPGQARLKGKGQRFSPRAFVKGLIYLIHGKSHQESMVDDSHLLIGLDWID